MAESAITTQPMSRRKEVESFVRDLDPNSVVGEWANQLFIRSGYLSGSSGEG